MSLAATATGTPPADVVIANNGWWPDIDPAHYRGTMRLPESVTPDRLTDGLVSAVDDINRQLADFQAAQTVAGYSGPQEIPRKPWQRPGYHADLYQRAVYCAAAALLAERYREITAASVSSAQDDAVASLISQADAYRRDSIHAVRDLLAAVNDVTGSRAVCELI